MLAFLLRCLYFERITFGYDQARDAFQAIEIWTTDPIKILGPRTDFVGLHHGPLYWYLISPVYYFSGGNVWVVRAYLIVLSSLTVFLIYSLTKLLFKKETVALLASLLFVFSFEATQYARWLSNPSPALITVALSFWLLWQILNGKTDYLPLLAFVWGLSTQFEFFMIYQIVAFLIIWLAIKGAKRPKLSSKTIVLTIAALIVSFFPFIVSELKFNFQGTRSLFSFFKTQSHFGGSFTKMLLKYLDRFAAIFFLNLWGINLFLAGILGLITLYLSHKLAGRDRKQIIFLLCWILSPLLLHFFKGTEGVFINLGAGIGAIILTSWLLDKLFNKDGRKIFYFLSIILIIFGNLSAILSQNKKGEVLFSVQDRLLLKDELAAIDWIYQQSDGRAFKINTITNPLFINTTWAYLFNWYGKRKYGYMPIWWGEAQVNVYGDQVNYAPEADTTDHYLIIEPGPGIPKEYVNAIRALEDTRSKIKEVKSFGTILVEKREITRPRVFTSQDVFELVKARQKN